MEFKKGDKVKFLNEAGGGVVSKVLENGQVLVQIEDGFEIPVIASQIFKTESSGSKEIVKNEQQFSKQVSNEQKAKIPDSNANANKSVVIKKKLTAKPYFAIVPLTDNFTSEKDIQFDLFLLNDGGLYFYYTVAFEKFNNCELIEKGELEPEMKVKIGTFGLLQLLSLDAIILEFLIYNLKEYENKQPIHYRINMKSLFLKRGNNYIENDFFYEPALIFDIQNEFKKNEIIVPVKEKLTIEKPIPKNNNDLEEVDLHIEEIMDDFANLSNGEIINIQLARFTTALEGAIHVKTKRIVFIHGVGNGKLKYELCKTLDSKYPDLKYQDASYAEYGFGATMVLIR